MFHLRKVWYSLLFSQTKISSTQGSFVSSLGEICQVVFFFIKLNPFYTLLYSNFCLRSGLRENVENYKQMNR